MTRTISRTAKQVLVAIETGYADFVNVCKTLIRRFDPDPRLQPLSLLTTTKTNELARALAFFSSPDSTTAPDRKPPQKTANERRRRGQSRTGSRTVTRTAAAAEFGSNSQVTFGLTSPAKDGFVDVISRDAAGLPYYDLATIGELVGLDSDSDVWLPIPGLPAQERPDLNFGGVEVWQ